MNAQPRTQRASLFALIALLMLPPTVGASDLLPAEEELFERHARPLLSAHCIRCHGQGKQESGLNVTTLQSLLQGGESGPAIVPGNPNESLLLQALRYESFEMPPDNPLSDEQIAGIAEWIKAGAPWPARTVLEPVSPITDEDREWWCYQPITDPEVPELEDDRWCRNEIDRFIAARLAKDNIEPSVEAKNRTLARRVHFALTGLPPGESTNAFVTGEESCEQLVDRLLNEPSYGENQARYWLDLVRYADSDGYRADHPRPEAKKYRDYVIRSFNDDKPYDRFVTEQLAGDEIDPGNRDALTATMFLRLWIYEHNQRDVETQWSQILDDITETTADAFLAQGVRCARCHDHKFDPLLQQDYFRLKAFFAAFQPREDMPLGTVEKRHQFLERESKWLTATADIRKELHEIETPVLLNNATKEGFDKFVTELKSIMLLPAADRTPYEHQIASLAMRQLELHPDKLPKQLDEKTEVRRQQLREQLAEFDVIKPKPLPTLSFVASDVGPVAPVTFIPDDRNKTPIAPGFLSILDDQPANILPPADALQSTGRRSALARWIASPDNPLTARVIVNRIWQQHFGKGLVDTSSDFGHLGTPPSHPHLLDWLASRFIEDGWSLKKLHRRILSSATYRQTTQRPATEQLATLDPDNHLLWRMNPRRLSGEEITDTMLTAGDELTATKRAIYKHVRRNNRDPLLALFDFPDRIRSAGQRHRTTTSPQALLLMNNPWVMERAVNMAKKHQDSDDRELIQQGYEELFFRSATQHEINVGLDFIESYASVTSPPDTFRLAELKPAGRSAIDLHPKDEPSIKVPWSEELPDGDFTLEAMVLLRSLYPDASVRSIAGHWNGSRKSVGWALGVTSTKSAYKPGNLILQLVGTDSNGKQHYEVIASNLQLELNRPYHVGVAVRLNDATSNGITFALKDLSTQESPLQTASVAHNVMAKIRPKHELEVGGRSGHHRWDGLISNVRLHRRALDIAQVTLTSTDNVVLNLPLGDANQPGKDISGNGYHAQIEHDASRLGSPQFQARVSLIHALLNSNELIYVD